MSRSYWLPVIALGLIVCASASQSQPPQNRSHEAVEHQGEPGGGYSAPNPLLPPIVVAPIKAEPYSFQPAADEQAKQHDDGVKWTDIAIVFLTLVLAGCGIAGAIIAYRQWDALREQVTKLGEAIAAETQSGKDRAVENAAALAAARTANKIAIGTGRAQTRAYLVIRYARLTPYTFGANIDVEVANIGQTPVKWVETEAVAQILPDIITKSNEVPINPFGGMKHRWPTDPGQTGRDYPLFVDEGSRELRKLVTQARFEQSIVVQGVVRWCTIFDEIYESTFFFWGVPVPPQYEETKPGSGNFDRQIPQTLSAPADVEIVTYRRVKKAQVTTEES